MGEKLTLVPIKELSSLNIAVAGLSGRRRDGWVQPAGSLAAQLPTPHLPGWLRFLRE